MPGLSRTSSVWLPVAVILIAMLSIQSGASLAKSLFPLVGAPGVTALRIVLGTAILVVIFKPWRLRFKKEQRLPLLFYGLSLGAMNYLFYLSIQTIPLGIAVALWTALLPTSLDALWPWAPPEVGSAMGRVGQVVDWLLQPTIAYLGLAGEMLRREEQTSLESA